MGVLVPDVVRLTTKNSHHTDLFTKYTKRQELCKQSWAIHKVAISSWWKERWVKFMAIA